MKLASKLRFLLEETVEPKRMHLSIPLPDDLLRLSDIFKTAGKKFYLVGGAVRDALLGKQPKDLDIATDAAPEEVRDIIASYPEYKILDLGVAFGIVKIVTPEGNDYEIARFRQEEYNHDTSYNEFLKYIKNKGPAYEERLRIFTNMPFDK